MPMMTCPHCKREMFYNGEYGTKSCKVCLKAFTYEQSKRAVRLRDEEDSHGALRGFMDGNQNIGISFPTCTDDGNSGDFSGGGGEFGGGGASGDF